ncbi:copper resistance protein CopZ [Flavipsychrobacter stenotrophus]|uniref:Copper resistance protein CopZ n=1 Tax=Flavipsychrobacter stenotrophus TaxID=2077091 RepID=A0A2S7SZH8_9BACT|nr:heavy metal-associated domain-containing protein [Flavipsychrobacter stenotrophus]PQJ12332.1 copper resistance protein CopZ [Flavipsychrobacter stenotrophus]
MKKEYELQGMSCGGCVSNVKRALLQVPDVTEAEVHLNPQGAVITMNKSIAVDELQTQLKKAGHYTIKEIVSNLSA